MKRFVVSIFMFGFTLLAAQKYNAMENRWETVPNDWDMQYNAMENDWSYQPRNSQLEYNAMENSWDWDSGHNNY